MNNLAAVVLDALLFLNFSESEDMDFQTSERLFSRLTSDIERNFSIEEKQAVRREALLRLTQRQPAATAHAYLQSRAFLTDEQCAFLSQIAEGHFQIEGRAGP